jgi:quercetin dioxygenase-like cupin family protein
MLYIYGKGVTVKRRGKCAIVSVERTNMKIRWKIVVLAMLSLVGSAHGHAGDEQKIVRAEEQSSFTGSPDFFTGAARVETAFAATGGIPAVGGFVAFAPGARSNWHYHPAGQQIIVISGVGRTGTRDGKVEAFRAGDVVTCPPGVQHWHGASPTVAMTHLTITGQAGEKNTEWLEPVTDQQYMGK